MGNCFGAEATNDQSASNGQQRKEGEKGKPGVSRMEQVNEDETIILKMKIQKDRLTSRMKEMERKETAADAEIKDLLKAGNKDKAKFKLTQKKMIKEQLKKYRMQDGFIDQQVYRIEQAKDDVEFTGLLKESNKTLQSMMEKIDLAEIETAKMLQAESQMSRDQMNEMLGDEDDDELDEELKKMEAEALGNNLGQADLELEIEVDANADANANTKQAQLA